MKSFESFIALRYLLGSKKSGFISIILGLSTIGVFLGTFVLIIALSVMNGFEQEVKDRIVGTFAHIKINQYHAKDINNPDSIINEIKDLKGVVGASPFISDKIGLASKDVRDGLMMMGIDPEKEKTITEIENRIVEGSYNLSRGLSKNGKEMDAIILGRHVANRLKVYIGDEVTAISLKGAADMFSGFTPKMKKLRVTGLYESGMYEYDNNLSFMSLDVAADLLNLEGATGIQIKTDDPFKADLVAEKIQEKLGYPYYAIDWMKQNHTLFEWINTEQIIAFIIISLIILIATFNITSSLLMIIMEKTGEIGILLSMGASRYSIKKIFIITAMTVGVLGSFAGTFLATILCYIQETYKLIPLPGDVYFLPFFPVRLEFLHVLAVFFTANILCFIFALFPASKAASLLPVEALKYE